MTIFARLLIAFALLTAGSYALAAPGPGDHGGHGHDRGHDRHHDNRGHGDRRHDDRRHDNRRYVRSHGYGHAAPRYYGRPHRWERGHRYYGPTYVVRDYRHYRLRHPPRGYRWVRANNDYLLVAIATGIILDVALR